MNIRLIFGTCLNDQGIWLLYCFKIHIKKVLQSTNSCVCNLVKFAQRTNLRQVNKLLVWFIFLLRSSYVISCDIAPYRRYSNLIIDSRLLNSAFRESGHRHLIDPLKHIISALLDDKQSIEVVVQVLYSLSYLLS